MAWIKLKLKIKLNVVLTKLLTPKWEDISLEIEKRKKIIKKNLYIIWWKNIFFECLKIVNFVRVIIISHKLFFLLKKLIILYLIIFNVFNLS